jgi:hypothetical protein
MTGVNPSFDDLRKMTLEFAKEHGIEMKAGAN